VSDSASGADISEDRVFRYKLWRRWSDQPALVVIGLNPSTADESKDDPTIRKCIGFAKRDGYGGLVMLNLFAFRATDPKEMILNGWQVGPRNTDVIEATIADPMSGRIVAAWGGDCPKATSRRVVEWLTCAVRLWCWGTTKDGLPRHPLYLSNKTKLEEYRG